MPETYIAQLSTDFTCLNLVDPSNYPDSELNAFASEKLHELLEATRYIGHIAIDPTVETRLQTAFGRTVARTIHNEPISYLASDAKMPDRRPGSKLDTADVTGWVVTVRIAGLLPGRRGGVLTRGGYMKWVQCNCAV